METLKICLVLALITGCSITGSAVDALPCYNDAYDEATDMPASTDLPRVTEKVDIHIAKKFAYQGIPTVLSCDINEKPEAIKWSKINGELPSDARQLEGNLIITPKLSDSGFYTCQTDVSGEKTQKVIELVVRMRQPRPLHNFLGTRRF
ncbi:uncharacterized protein LOC129584169 [Paramacrobiotus metropolitanus]|uniref:uncharacterized protein LOC129584169 n=1 Tax=Paramacrobiotus metropolitanus TaxID=2943436 RepID=UPI002445AF26|nr:uncharacterized protein LOC129584169 [Paramacrobiotus metropolitanus]